MIEGVWPLDEMRAFVLEVRGATGAWLVVDSRLGGRKTQKQHSGGRTWLERVGCNNTWV